MAELGGFQLLPQTKKQLDFKEPGKNRSLILSIVLFVVVAAAVSGEIIYAQTLSTKVTQANLKITQLEETRDAQAEKNLAILARQAREITTVVSNHIIWTKALARFSSLLQAQINAKSITASLKSNTLEFNGVAPNYTIIAQQMAAFRASDTIDDVMLGNVGVNPTGTLDFSMTVLLNPTKLLRND